MVIRIVRLPIVGGERITATYDVADDGTVRDLETGARVEQEEEQLVNECLIMGDE